MKTKIDKLKLIIKEYNNVIVSYSGGVDSTLLCYLCNEELKDNFLAVTFYSEIYSKNELSESIEIAKKYKWPHLVINSKEIEHNDFISNKKDRCAFCKSLRSKMIIKIAKEKNIDNILSGENTDDLNDYRPGLKIAKETGIKMPLMEANMSKKDIRDLAKQLNLTNWDKPASPCLATRIPYNNKITKEALKKIDLAETFIKNLGYKNIRVRHHNDLARIEIDKEKIINFVSFHGDLVNKQLKQLGYNHVAIDIQGYRTGSLNEAIIK